MAEDKGAERIEVRIAEQVRAAGGTTYYVGGPVRDRLMAAADAKEAEAGDVDIEVHGISPEELQKILAGIGEPLSFGKSFGVYSLRGWDIDIAMPRRERATGTGHKDFEIFVDPFLGTREAARRRDFTINALMEDVLTGEIIDHFGGVADIQNKMIRHVDDRTFPEDPLRVLRAAQFAARFGFTIAEETMELCRGIDISTLSRERVETEMKKALLKAERPSVFFESLREMDQLEIWMPELAKTIGIEQDPVYHPEGDVWTHTMEVLDRAAQYRDKVPDPYAFMLLALTHDMGKVITTEEINGRIHAYGHEIEGLELVEPFLERLVSGRDVIRYVLNMVPLHMRPNVAAYSKPSLKSTNRLFDAAAEPEDLIYFAFADRPVFAGTEAFSGDGDFLFDRLEQYRETMAKPHVTGQDLVDAGFEPGEYFTDVLNYAHKLRLAGVEKPSALKQTIAYARKYKS